MDAQTSLLVLLALEMLALRILEQWTKIVRNAVLVTHEPLLAAPDRPIATRSASEVGYRAEVKFENAISGRPIIVSTGVNFPDVDHVTDPNTEMHGPECNGEKCPEGGMDGGGYDPPEDVEDKEKVKEGTEAKEKGNEGVLLANEPLLVAPNRSITTRSVNEDSYRAEVFEELESVVSNGPGVRFAMDFSLSGFRHESHPGIEMDGSDCNGEKCSVAVLRGGGYDPPEEAENKEKEKEVAEDKEKGKEGEPVSLEPLLVAPDRSIATRSASEDGYQIEAKFETSVSAGQDVSIGIDVPDAHHVTDFDTQMDRPECNGEKCPQGAIDAGGYDHPEDVEDKEKEKGGFVSYDPLLVAPNRSIATRSASGDSYRAKAKFQSVVSVGPGVRFAIDFPLPGVDHITHPDTEMDGSECNGEKCSVGVLSGGGYNPPEDAEDKEKGKEGVPVSLEPHLVAPDRSFATRSASEDGYRTEVKFETSVSAGPVVSIGIDVPDAHHVTDFDTQMNRPECNREKCPQGAIDAGGYDPPEDVEDKEKEKGAEDKEKGK